jgi:hypothetical protein
MDAILDMQIKKDRKFFTAPDARYAQAIYRHTSPMSLFRKYAAKGVFYFLAKNVGSMKRVQILLQENVDFCADFLKYLELRAVYLPSDILQCDFITMEKMNLITSVTRTRRGTQRSKRTSSGLKY